MGAGGGEGRGGADRHHQPLLLAGGHPRGAAGLELGREALAELVAVGVVDVDQEIVVRVGLVPADVEAEPDVEAPLVGELGQAQHVPAAADHVELAVDRLAVIRKEQEADLHRQPLSTGRSEISSVLPPRSNWRSTVSFLR